MSNSKLIGLKEMKEFRSEQDVSLVIQIIDLLKDKSVSEIKDILTGVSSLVQKNSKLL